MNYGDKGSDYNRPLVPMTPFSERTELEIKEEIRNIFHVGQGLPDFRGFLDQRLRLMGYEGENILCASNGSSTIIGVWMKTALEPKLVIVRFGRRADPIEVTKPKGATTSERSDVVNGLLRMLRSIFPS